MLQSPKKVGVGTLGVGASVSVSSHQGEVLGGRDNLEQHQLAASLGDRRPYRFICTRYPLRECMALQGRGRVVEVSG